MPALHPEVTQSTSAILWSGELSMRRATRLGRRGRVVTVHLPEEPCICEADGFRRVETDFCQPAGQCSRRNGEGQSDRR